jgi:hypothetical protein
LLDEAPIRRGVHQCLDLGCIRYLEDRDPTVAVGLLVDELGALFEQLVALGHGAGHRREDVGDSTSLKAWLALTSVPTSGTST